MAWPFSKALKIQDFLALNPSSPLAIQVASPWSTANAQLIAWSEHFNGYAEIVTREVAVQVPAVSRAEKLLVGLADVPLVAEKKDTASGLMVPVDPQPTWTQRTDGPMTPWHRMAATIRDLYYDNWSIWLVERGAGGQILRAQQVQKQRIELPGDGTMKVDGRFVSHEEVIFFPGPGLGLLLEAANTIRGAKAIEKAWVQRVQSPIPLVVLKETIEHLNLSDDEIEAVKDSWIGARGNLNGAVGYVPYGMDVDTHTGGDDSALYVEGRNAIRLDVANFSNIPAALLDGSTATASLTYVTQEGQRSSFHEQSVRYWLAPIEHRLSQDDVVPARERVRFDIAFLNNTPQEVTSD